MNQSLASRHALAFIFVTVLIDAMGLGIIIPVLPKLITTLAHEGLDDAARTGSYLWFAYARMQFLFAPVLGNLSDRFGRRPVLIISLAGICIDYMIMGFAPTVAWLFLGRTLSGMAGASYSTAAAYIADVSSAERRAQSFGLIGAAFGATRSSVTLVLAGVAVVSLFTAIQTFVLQRNNDVIREVYSWILGRVSNATWADVRLVLPYVIVSSVVLLLHRRHLDLFRVGDDEAASLGSDVARIRIVVVIAATMGTAAVVSVSGLIGFVGVIVPHAVRMLAGASYRRVLPLSLIVGATFLILVDIPGRVLQDPAETPIGVVTAFFGAPFFIVLLRSKKSMA